MKHRRSTIESHPFYRIFMLGSRTAAATAGSAKSKNPWIEYGAALWAFAFACLHIAWSFGWYPGLDAESARKAFARSWFFTYNLIAAGLCFLAVAVALAPIQSWGRKIPRAFLKAVARACAVILALRGGAGALGAIYFAIVGNSFAPLFSFWDWWFCLGAGLFAASAWRFTRQTDSFEFDK